MSRQPDTILADDLTRIKGIGPTIQSRLYEAGVFTYEQLAALMPEQIVVLLGHLPGLSVKRVAAEDWPGHAKALALTTPGSALDTPLPSGRDEATLIDRQHYATFTVELLLDDENHVDRTRVIHAQSGEEETPWAGWDEGRLIQFIVRCAGLRLPTPPPVSAATIPAPASEQAAEARADMLSAPTPTVGEPLRLGGELRIRELTPVMTWAQQEATTSEMPIQVDLDLTALNVPPATPLAYEVTLYARSTQRRGYRSIGQKKGILKPGEPPSVYVLCQRLEVGVYRLDGIVAVSLATTPDRPTTMIQAYLENRLLQVY